MNHKLRFGDPVGKWHYWFAWHPIRTWDGRWIWLRTVHRRLIQKHSYLDGGPNQWMEYHYTKGYVNPVSETPPAK